MNNIFTRCIITCFILFGLASLSYGKTIYVSGDYPTIQAGIDAASNGDIVMVAAEIYTGAGNKNLDFKGKAITVESVNGAAATIIDCEKDGRGFYFHSGESSSSVVNGFTIQNGEADQGGGIYCFKSSPRIIDCIISGNSAGWGGGIFCPQSAPNIVNCTIIENSVAYYGGGIYCNGYTLDGSSPAITNCTISRNSAIEGGGINCLDSSLAITNSIITENSAIDYGGGICYSQSPTGQKAPPTVINCTISRNSAVKYGGGIYCSASSPTVLNTILWADTAPSGSEIYLWPGASITITYSDIQGGWPGEGNINTDPMFVNADGGDYHLRDSSPCIGAGTIVDAPDHDIEGNPRPNPPGSDPDMGAYENPLGEPIESPTVIRVPGEYPIIQVGIDAIQDGDTVLVADGTYKGDGNKNLDFKGKAITVISENGPENCIIDCEGNGRGFNFHSYETSESVVSGFTIINGSVTSGASGGGIYCENSSPTIKNNEIVGNSANNNGGGIYCFKSSPTIQNNRIIGNLATSDGGGICCYESSPSIQKNKISGNSANSGGGIFCAQSFPRMQNNEITGNSANDNGGGVYCANNSSPMMINNTISGNSADWSGGGISFRNSSSVVKNTILWENNPQEILLIDSSINITFSNIQGGWPGEGNINADPMFVNPENEDYHLQAGSPCINAGTPEGAPSDDIEGNLRDAHPDIGAYEYAAPPDTTPPTPNTIVSIVAVSATQIDITSAEAQDDTPPVFYRLDGQYYDGATWLDSGGGVSDYDYSITRPNPWSDTNLVENGWYRYRQQVKDSATPPNESAWSDWVEKYTLANTPSTPTVSNPTSTTLDVQVNPNGNPDYTLFAIYNVTGGYYLNASGGSNGATEVWQTKSDWGIVTVVNLTPEITYEFKCKAQNGDGVETPFGPSGSGTTAAASVFPIKILPESQTIKAGKTATINLQIENVADLGGFEFKLRYKTNIIEITASDIQVGAFLTSTGKQVINATPKFSTDEDDTILFYGATTYGDQPSPSGTGVLVTIALKGIGAGTTGLDLFDVQAGDADANPISVDAIDGSITVESILYGDVSGDGTISAYDASLVLQYIVGSIKLSPEQRQAADVTGNDTISALDAALILQYTVGLITKFPVDSEPIAPAMNPKNETQILVEALAQLENASLTKEQKHVLEQLKNLVFSQLIPNHTTLLQNFPNPFNPETWIPFALSQDAIVTIRIYDIAGRLVRKLELGNKSAGFYTTKDRSAYWNGHNEAGERASSGLYFYTIQAGSFTATKRMILVK